MTDYFGTPVDEDNQSQVSDEGGEVQNDPNESEIEDINSRGPSLDDLDGGEAGGGGSSGSSSPVPEFGFSIEDNGGDYVFAPKYYPDRFNINRARKTESTSDSCKGENITLKMLKGSRIHAKGIFLYERNLSNMHSLAGDVESKAVLYNDILPNDGLECYIEDVQYGEMEGYDAVEKDWLLSYSVDLIGRGGSNKSSSGNGIVDGLDSTDAEVSFTEDFDF